MSSDFRILSHCGRVFSTWIFLSLETPGLFYRPVTSKNILVYLDPASQMERCIQKCFLNVRLFALLFDIEENGNGW